MSSLRHHRIIIASLFLPTTIVIGDSTPPSPDENALAVGTPGPTFLQSVPPTRSTLQNKPAGPLRSIVEDLKDKVSDDTHVMLNLWSGMARLEMRARIMG